MTTEGIRALNDQLRRNLLSGHVTSGVAALGAETVVRIIKMIAVYDDFCHANDPYEQHDFGSLEADGHLIASGREGASAPGGIGARSVGKAMASS
jgi:hypothetical protein